MQQHRLNHLDADYCFVATGMDPVMTQRRQRPLEGAARGVWGGLAMETPKGGSQGPSRRS